MKLLIKNMVCPRCVESVTGILTAEGLAPKSVVLGEAEINEDPDASRLRDLNIKLQQAGFELLEDNRQQLVEKIKSIIINRIHHNERNPVAFSELLAGELHRDYSGLSKIFSSTEGITIEQYVILQKTERVKELLLYNQLTLSEIAHQMGYSSVAHLSAQFRKTTGMTPTAFKNEGAHLRRPLDNISG